MSKNIPRCISAANRIINRTNAQNRYRIEIGKPRVKLTGRRLQKILYLCELFLYIDHEECDIIPEDFYAWATGPVIPEIYNYWSVYQDGGLLPWIKADYILSEEEKYIINAVVDNTVDLSTESIIDFTQLPNGPWKQVYKDYQGGYHAVISKNSIKQYIRNEENQRELLDFIKNQTINNEEEISKKMLPPKDSKY